MRRVDVRLPVPVGALLPGVSVGAIGGTWQFLIAERGRNPACPGRIARGEGHRPRTTNPLTSVEPQVRRTRRSDHGRAVFGGQEFDAAHVKGRRLPTRPSDASYAPAECLATEMRCAAPLLVVAPCHSRGAAMPEERPCPAMPVTNIAGMGVDYRRVADSDAAWCAGQPLSGGTVARTVCSGSEPEFESVLCCPHCTSHPNCAGVCARNGPWSGLHRPHTLSLKVPAPAAGAATSVAAPVTTALVHITIASQTSRCMSSLRFGITGLLCVAADKGVLCASSTARYPVPECPGPSAPSGPNAGGL